MKPKYDSQCYEVDGIAGGRCCYCGTDVLPGYGFGAQAGDGICCEECDERLRQNDAANIRYRARKCKLVAKRSRRSGLWYFSDRTNLLVSSADGLEDWEALAFLRPLLSE